MYWTLFTVGLQFVKGPLSVLFILTFLSQEQQGIWYTFLSLAGVSVFAELGFTRIITRFVSHEYAHVHAHQGLIAGDREDVDRLFSLIRYSIGFYCIVVPVAIVILMAIGVYIFSGQSPAVLPAWIDR